ncbi:hypothetical protein HDU85_002969 [Gaertneriomyces sp. JEL0708]|nr:hypothetical protein HDU85_002969 [Gaertneriomyces sp. JEL0708]
MPSGKVLCFGSVNIDDVYEVPHIVLTGETISSLSYTVHAGGKGANQSVALAKAQADVYHGGRIGKDGIWVKDLMHSAGVKTDYLDVDNEKAGGRAIIQVSAETNDNAIVLFPGTNASISLAFVDSVLAHFEGSDWVLLQNEINIDAARHVAETASQKGMTVVINPAPCPADFAQKFPLNLVDMLIVNESEAASITAQLGHKFDEREGLVAAAAGAAKFLLGKFENLKLVVVTLGGKGVAAELRHEHASFQCSPLKGVRLANTTGAGDTFVGYLLAILSKASSPFEDKRLLTQALQLASTAAGMACESEGAMTSIPLWEDVVARAQANW